MATRLSEGGIKGLKGSIDSAVADQGKGLPGAVVSVIGKDGQLLFTHAAGKRAVDRTDSMTLDSVLWIASCTKMITGIATMQLVEQGKLSLDDADQVEYICPELKSVKVLRETGKDKMLELTEKTKRITLRMLLNHTAGFGYTFFNEKLCRWSRPTGFDEFSGNNFDMLQPLVGEPGEEWNYGINIDWAGIIVERVSGLSLNDYFQKNIFKPLGLNNISMIPTPQMKHDLATMHQRAPDGTLSTTDHILHRPLTVEGDEIKTCFNSGGAGCFARPVEYCQILALLLNNGVSPTTGVRLLNDLTVEEMFKNQIPEFPNFGRQLILDAKPTLTNKIPELYPQPHDQHQGWGLTFMLTPHPGATGRGPNTGHWAGLPNLYWWCDRLKGVAGIVGTQILPFADPKVLGLWVEVESAVYKSLEKS